MARQIAERTAFTMMPVCVAVMPAFLSVAVSDWVPAVFKVALNVCTPWSLLVKV
ncbi:MAG TPA: hypothetical protein VG099_00675 [Gemmataceae bacterium]|jgi:hypothetical protein|nr:hypothetical protein [Gemmataceae bacterium]